MTDRTAAGRRAGTLETAEAWELLRRIRSRAEAEAAGLRRDADGRTDWQGASPEAQDLADRYLPLCLAGPRTAFAQLGQSLDGFIASRSGDADYVTAAEDREHLHRLRALADAVVVGAGTAVADDPRLTVRACTGANPVRVILDPHRRVPLQHRVFSDGSAPTLWVVAARGERGSTTTDAAAPAAPGAQAEPGDPDRTAGAGNLDGAGSPEEVGGLDGVDVLTLPDTAAFTPRRLLDELARRGLGRVLVEGGGVTVSRFLHAGALHRLYLTVAPVLLGDGVRGLGFPGPDLMRDALRPPVCRRTLGQDTLFELDLAAAQTGEPLDEEHTDAGQTGGEGEHPVHHSDGQPLSGPQTRG